MRQLNNIRLLMVAICSVFMFGSCSDFPDELYFDGSINVKKGEVFYDAETNTYTQELIIDVNVTEASEDITRAYVKMEGKEIDFTNKINKRKGGKAKVKIDELKFSHRYIPEIIVESPNFHHSAYCDIEKTRESFCKISNFRISLKADPYKGADVSFRVDDNPFASNLPIILDMGNSLKVTVSDTSEKGDYHFDLENIDMGKTYKCYLQLGNYDQATDYVEYTTPENKAVIEVEDVYISSHKGSSWSSAYDTYTYRLIATVKSFDSIQGDKSLQLWEPNNAGVYQCVSEDVEDTGKLSIDHTFYRSNSSSNKRASCEFRLYVNGDKWAVVKSYYSYRYK